MTDKSTLPGLCLFILYIEHLINDGNITKEKAFHILLLEWYACITWRCGSGRKTMVKATEP